MLPLIVLACDPGTVEVVTVVDPAPRDSSVLHVRVLRPDGSPASGARVEYLNAESRTYEFLAAETGADGYASLTALPQGWVHWIASEIHGADGSIFGGGTPVVGPEDSASVAIRLSQPRSQGLVISEVYGNAPQAWETGNAFYHYGMYVEIANLSDAAVYLDGMLLGKAYHYYVDSGTYGHHRCEDTESVRNDPEGIWATTLWMFPGSGAEYLLAPGAAALVAVSAADHSGIHPTILDLSHADFEFGVPEVADNPAAANMVWLGPAPTSISHFTIVRAFWVLARPGDPTGFPRVDDPGVAETDGDPDPLVRVPAELIEDVTLLEWDPSQSYLPTRARFCTYIAHPNFDQLPGGFMRTYDLEVSPQRRRVTVEGRSILLDTNTSWVDFERAERTPGWLP